MVREMKDSGIKWIGEIPKKWKISKMKYVAEFMNGDRGNNYPSGDDMVDEGIIFITSNNIHNIVLDSNMEISKYITESKYRLLGGAKLEINDIIFCLRGSVGLCAINKSVKDGAIASSLVCIRACKINADFLNYLLHSEISNYQTSFFTNGTCAANLSAENVSNYFLVLPSIEEQRRIVGYLDRKCAEIDSLTLDIQAQISILEDYKKSVITDAVTKGLNPDIEMKDSGVEWIGQIPKHWEVTSITNIKLLIV